MSSPPPPGALPPSAVWDPPTSRPVDTRGPSDSSGLIRIGLKTRVVQGQPCQHGGAAE